MAPVEKTWVLEPHLCSDCGSRILKCVTGNGMTPGGNPVRRCADCGRTSADTGPHGLCWCGVTHKSNNEKAYRCLSFSILESEPWLEEAFRACGTDPKRGDIGVVLISDLARLRARGDRPLETSEAAMKRIFTPVRAALERTKAAKGKQRSDMLDSIASALNVAEWQVTSLLKGTPP